MNSKESKTMTQVKLTSMYRNNTTRGNNSTSKSYLASGSNISEECLIVERPLSFHSQNKGQSSFPSQRIEDEDRAYGNSLGTKRLHMEIKSPNTKSPLSNEDANTDNFGNGFVTAKAKLVTICLLTAFFFLKCSYLYYVKPEGEYFISYSFFCCTCPIMQSILSIDLSP